MEFKTDTTRGRLFEMAHEIFGIAREDHEKHPSDMDLVLLCLEGLLDMIEESKDHSHKIS